MNIYLTRTKGISAEELKKIWELLYESRGPMKFHILNSPPLDFHTDDFDFDDFFTVMKHYRAKTTLTQEDFLVTISELCNSANWFSIPDLEGSYNIYIHGREWDNYVYCDSKYPLAYEVVANVLHRLFVDKDLTLSLFHEQPIGCISDFCDWKPDIILKFRTGDICEACIQRFQLLNVSDDILRQALSIFSDLRKSMLFSTTLQSTEQFDYYLPHNIAVTKRKIASTNEPLKKFLFLIDHFDSLIRTAVIYWSTINKSEEDRRRFFQGARLTNRPGLGAWLNALKNLVQELPLSADTKELLGHINSNLADMVTRVDLREIVNMRNEKRGHGYIDCNDDSYRADFLKYLPIVNTIETLLKPLFNSYSLCYVQRISKRGNTTWTVSILKFESSDIIFKEEIIEIQTGQIDEIPADGKVYLLNRNQKRFFDLTPMMYYALCPECKQNRLLVVDGEVYIDPLVGHRINYTPA